MKLSLCKCGIASIDCTYHNVPAEPTWLNPSSNISSTNYSVIDLISDGITWHAHEIEPTISSIILDQRNKLSVMLDKMLAESKIPTKNLK